MNDKYKLFCKKIVLLLLIKIRACASLINKITGIRWPETIMALATAVLAIVTWRYVILTDCIVKQQINQTNQQKEQFELVNRPRVWFNGLSGDIHGGNLSFINVGNLQADNCRFLWRIVKIEGGKILQDVTEQSNTIEIDNLDQDEIFPLSYSSKFNLDEQFIFMVVLWKYSGAGIKEYQLKDEILLWNIDQKPNAAWVRPSSSMGWDHRKALDIVKEQLQSILDKK